MKWRRDQCSPLYPGNVDLCGLGRGSRYQLRRRLWLLVRGYLPRGW